MENPIFYFILLQFQVFFKSIFHELKKSFEMDSNCVSKSYSAFILFEFQVYFYKSSSIF